MSVHEGDVVHGDLLPRRDGRLRAHRDPRTGVGFCAHTEIMANNGVCWYHNINHQFMFVNDLTA